MNSATAKSRTTSRQERSRQTELSLLRATTWLLSERGFHGTGIRDIADAAQIAISGMYYYAKSKDDLLEEIMRRSLESLTSSARVATAELTDPAARLVTIVGTHVLFHTSNPRSAVVTDQDFAALTGQARKRVLRMRDDYEKVWTDALAAGLESAEFVDRRGLAKLALLQMTTGVAHWYAARGPLKPEEIWHGFAVMALGMLQVPDPEARLQAMKIPAHEALVALVRLETEPRRRPAGIQR